MRRRFVSFFLCRRHKENTSPSVVSSSIEAARALTGRYGILSEVGIIRLLCRILLEVWPANGGPEIRDLC